jgi:RNase P subunit RPR2
MYDYPNMRRITYGEQNATFVPVCPECGRFVTPDKTVSINADGLCEGTNATCKRCGRVEMPFEGFI